MDSERIMRCPPGAILDSLLAGVFPQWAVDLLVERRTAGRELAQLVALGAHQGRAVAERPADALAVEPAVVAELPGEVGLRQRAAADPDEGDAAVAHVRGPGVTEVFLQIT